MDSFNILTYIASDCVGDGSCTVITEICILNLQDRVQLYERLFYFQMIFSGVQKFTTLENVVGPIPHLKVLKH